MRVVVRRAFKSTGVIKYRPKSRSSIFPLAIGKELIHCRDNVRKQIRTEAPCCPNIISCNVKVGLVDSVEPADVLLSSTLPHETLVVKPVQVPAAVHRTYTWCRCAQETRQHSTPVKETEHASLQTVPR